MPDVRIAHLHRRYRMPSDAVSERPRLDRILQSAITDDLFDAALERAGIPAGEEICIRRVESVVRLDSAQPEARLAVAWSVALADAIAQRVSDGGPDVIRYRTRYLALADMACAATVGDLERAWAWRSLGIWRTADVVDTNEARGEVIAALAREARLAPAALRVVAKRGLLPLLVSSVSIERWVTLAHASLVEWGASGASIGQILADSSEADVAINDAERIAANGAVARIVASSAVTRASSARRGVEAVSEMQLARALAALAMIECEPALVASERGVVVARLLAQQITRSATKPKYDTGTARQHVQTRRDALVASSVDENEEAASDTSPRSDFDVDAVVGDARQRAATSWGGLLFLLHIVQALDLPAILSRDSALAGRSLRWSLHQLAMLLAPVAEGDPAALAFAGIAPQSRAPSADEPSPTADERSSLHSATASIVAQLRARIGATDNELDATLVQRITSRTAEVVADTPWIEIRLASSEVSTDVRRAGLDLDPGWIPWLGVVVRFVYV